MNVFLRMEGSCPVCGSTVPRLVGDEGERYACPDHGLIQYASPSVTLAQWAENLADRSYS